MMVRCRGDVITNLAPYLLAPTTSSSLDCTALSVRIYCHDGVLNEGAHTGELSIAIIADEALTRDQFIADIRGARVRDLEEKRINKEMANIRKRFKGRVHSS